MTLTIRGILYDVDKELRELGKGLIYNKKERQKRIVKFKKSQKEIEIIDYLMLDNYLKAMKPLKEQKKNNLKQLTLLDN